MLRVLFGVIVLLTIGVAISPLRRARLLGFFLAIPLGSVLYFFLGLGIARCLGVGRFYSIPIGAEHIADEDIVISLVFWIGCTGGLLQWLIWRRKRAA